MKKNKKKYYLYYTYTDSLKFVPCDEFKEPLKIIYNKNNTIIFCIPPNEEEEKEDTITEITFKRIEDALDLTNE